MVGFNSGPTLTVENAQTLIGSQADGAGGITNSTAIGANASVTQSNSLVLGSINGVNGASASTSVGISTTAPKARLDVAAGDAYLSTAGNGVILKSPDGTICKRLSIDNAGTLITTAIACP